MRAKYIKPRKGARNPKWRIQYFGDDGEYLGSEMGYKLKEHTREKAEEKMRAIERRKHLEEAGITQPTDRPAAETIEEYIAIRSPKGGPDGRPWSKTYTKQNRHYLPWWIETLRVQKPKEITLTAVERILNGKPHLAGGTKNRLFKYVNGWLNYCVERKYLAANPLAGFVFYNQKTNNPRRALKMPEAWDLFEKAPLKYSMLYQMAVLTGCRATALSKIETTRINWEKRTVRVEGADQKNGETMIYTLPDWYMARLRSYLATLPGTVVFPFIHVPSLSRTLQGHLAAAGIPFRTEEGKVDFHALRVTFGTWVNESDADPKTIQELLGHKTPIISLERYVKANQDRKNATVNGMGLKLLAAGQGTTPVQPSPAQAETPVPIGPESAGGATFRGSTDRRTSKAKPRTSADITATRAFLGAFLQAAQPGTPSGQVRTPERYPLGTNLPEVLALLHQLHPDDLGQVLDLARTLAARQGRARA